MLNIYIYIFIYPCVSNKFQRSYEIFFSHANFFRIQIYFVFFRLSLYIYCLVTRICGTKVADEKYVECFWSKKCNPLPKFSFDINVTFSSCSVDKTERNSSGRAKGNDNEYTKVCVSIREYVLRTVPTRRVSINPLHPKVSMHILHTVSYPFPQVLTRRFCRIIKSSYTC